MKSGLGRAAAKTGGFLIRIYQIIDEIWTWAGKGPKCWNLNYELLGNLRHRTWTSKLQKLWLLDEDLLENR